MTQKQTATFGHRALRIGGIALLLGGVLVLGLLGWRWRANVTVGQIDVQGTEHAPPDTLRRLAQVDSGAVMSDLDLALLADRVERHPWIERAEINPRWMLRMLSIDVTERTPAALALDRQGQPAYYLDRAGFAMPRPDSAGYDVPLVRGLATDYHPVRRVAPPSLQAVFDALPETDTESLVAEIELQPDSSVRVVTAPMNGHGAIPVRLGTHEPARKLRTLRAFAQQVLARRSSEARASIEQIDLRFEGQVITQEQPPG